MRKLAEFVQRNCTSSISIANFRLQARVISSVYKGFDPVNNDSPTNTQANRFLFANPREGWHSWSNSRRRDTPSYLSNIPRRRCNAAMLGMLIVILLGHHLALVIQWLIPTVEHLFSTLLTC